MFRGYFSSSVGLVGVDIAPDAARMLQLRECGGKIEVVGASMLEAPRTDTGLTDWPRYFDHLKQTFVAGRFSGRRCAVSIPRPELHLQSVRLPPMPNDELAQAIEWEASQRFGFDRGAMQADFIRTGACLQTSDNREEVLLIALSHASLARWLNPLLDAGLRPVAVEPWFTAMARTFSRQCRRESDRNRVRAVVEVGADGSSIIILRGDQIALCRTTDIGGARFDQALSEHLQLDGKAATELRASRIALCYGGVAAEPVDSSTDRAVFEAVRPLMNDLVKEAMLCLRYYGVTFRGHPPERLILTGVDGLEPHLDELLSQGCKLPVSNDDDIASLEQICKGARARMNRNPGAPAGWAVAAGLSMRGIVLKARKGATPDPLTVMRRGAA